MVFVMLNPSTADGTVDDPTIRRCLHFAEREGAVRLEVVNLYAYRATNPKALASVDDPVGPANVAAWVRAFDCADQLVFAWGSAKAPRKAEAVRDVVFHARDLSRVPPVCFGEGKGGPLHPLYQPNDRPLVPVSFR